MLCVRYSMCTFMHRVVVYQTCLGVQWFSLIYIADLLFPYGEHVGLDFDGTLS